MTALRIALAIYTLPGVLTGFIAIGIIHRAVRTR